jgi:predicted RNase H-like HicB family nuclease
MQYTAHIYKDGSKYGIEFPDLSDISTWANSLEQAKKEAKDALDLTLRGDLEDGLSLRKPKTKANSSKGFYPIEVDSQIVVAFELAEACKNIPAEIIAKKVGISKKTYLQMEKSVSDLSIGTINKIAKILGKKLEIRLVAT